MNKNTTTQPWRVVASEGCWQVWTAYDSTAGSRNNYVIADGIQSEAEANLLAQAPAMLEALKECLKAMQGVRNDPYTTCACAERLALASMEANKVLAKAEGKQ